MISLQQLTEYTNTLLDIGSFQDYCPNGLQIEGRPEVGRIACAVTASHAVVEQAIAWEADVLLVHHGYFWKGESQPITGIKYRRIKKLIQNEISLLAYHLPLDAHPELGNNAQLARLLGLQVEDEFAGGIGMQGSLQAPLSGEAFANKIATVLGQHPLHISGSERPLKKLAWCSGGAQGYLEQAALAGVDGYLTGEASEQSYHIAKEAGIHFYAAGHHATERYGVQALAKHLAEQFGLEVQFMEVANPV